MKKPVSLSIRSILVIGFGGLSLFGIVTALYLGISVAFQNTRELLAEQADTLVDVMVGEIDSRLRPVKNQANWISERVASGWLALRNPDYEEVVFFLDAVMAATPQVGGIAFISRGGDMLSMARGEEEMLVEDVSHNASMMEWVEAGRIDPKSVWGPPIWDDGLNAAIIVHETPLFDVEGYLGLLALAVPISDLSLHLSRISPTAFVLAGRNEVLAHSLLIDWKPVDQSSVATPESIYQGGSALVPLTEIGDAVLEQIWSAPYQDLVMLRGMGDTKSAATQLGDREYIFLYRTIDGYGPVPWTIGTYLNVETVGQVVKRLDWAVVAGFCLLLAILILSFFLSRILTRPISALAEATKAVQAGKFNEVKPLPRSHVKELDGAMLSFRNMVKGLSEREVIRQTLGRYVPEVIANQLLADNGDLPPNESVATILFADIAGFTALTEALGPSRIVEVLNAYFSRMTEIIEANGGVITQFQGDAILAIFNVPIEAPDHSERACRAAKLMRSSVEMETFAGQKLRSRIGINTGSVVAGAVGAKGRLTYTVHGDAVNRAARVEAMNKDTGTTILLTETTANLLEKMTVRKIGTLDVRGQAEAVTVFTIDD